MSRRLPTAPPNHDERNQNETRRTYMSLLREVTTRLEAVEAGIAEAQGG